MDQAKPGKPEKESKHKANAESIQPKKSEKPSARGSSIASFLGVFALAVAGVSLYYSYTVMQKEEHAAATQQQKSAVVQQLKQHVENGFSRQQETIQQLRAQLDHVRLKSDADTESWVLAEVEYLLRIAHHSLAYEGNVTVATKILNAADKRLQSLSHGGFSHVRAAMASDIAQLEAAPKVDQEGLVLRLAALSDRLDHLPLTDHKLSVESVMKKQGDDSKQKPHWREALHASLDALKHAVVIRRLDQPLKPLLAPEQHANLIENIQFQLTMASFAVLHRDAKLYQHAITQAREWVKDYLKATDNTAALVQGLDELSKIDVAPDVPPLQRSMSALKQAINRKAQSIAPDELPAGAQSSGFTPRMLLDDHSAKVLSS